MCTRKSMLTGPGLWMFVLTHFHTYETHRPAIRANSGCTRKLTIGSQPSAIVELRVRARGALIVRRWHTAFNEIEQRQTIALLRAVYNLPRGLLNKPRRVDGRNKSPRLFFVISPCEIEF